MSNVLKRMQAIQKARKTEAPAEATQVIADRYIADLEAKARKKAEEEIRHELIEAASAAELEGAIKKLDALQSEVNTLKELLTSERSQTAKLNDLLKAMKANEKMLSIDQEKDKSEHKALIKGLEEKIKTLEMALLEERTKPAPAPQIIKPEPRIMPTSFNAIPQRGADGKTVSVKLEPVYERPN